MDFSQQARQAVEQRRAGQHFPASCGTGRLEQCVVHVTPEADRPRTGKRTKRVQHIGGGKVDEARLFELLHHPYFSAPFPKSLDRNDFTADMAKGLSLEDGAATLTAFSAAAVGKALDLLPERPPRLIVCGGGRRNPALIEAIRARARVTPVLAEEVSWRGDAIEAECFAFLAVRVLRGLPLSFPLTTGVRTPTPGGRLAKAKAAA